MAIYLLESAWSTGLGRRLHTRACNALVERGFAELIIWVFEANDRGRRFYERMGMTLDTDVQTYFEAGGSRHVVVRYRAPLARASDPQ